MTDSNTTGLSPKPWFFHYPHEIDAIREILTELSPKGRCLAVPTADGNTPVAIRDAGFSPFEADVFPRFRPESGIHAVKADFIQPLPFADGAFRAIVSRGGLEHHAAQAHHINECARVLEPGGWFVITTTNMQNLRSRVTQLLGGHGNYHFRRSPITEITHVRPGRDGTGEFDGHVYPVGYLSLRYMLHRAGFSIRTISTGRISCASMLMAPLLLPPIWLTTRWHLRRWLPNHPEVRKEIMSHLMSPQMLLGKHLYLLAQKNE